MALNLMKPDTPWSSTTPGGGAGPPARTRRGNGPRAPASPPVRRADPDIAPGPGRVEAVALGTDGIIHGAGRGAIYADLSTGSPR